MNLLFSMFFVIDLFILAHNLCKYFFNQFLNLGRPKLTCPNSAVYADA